MIAWKNGFDKHKGEIALASRGDAKWHIFLGAYIDRVLLGVEGEGNMLRGGPVWERSAPMGYVRLSPYYVVPPNKKWEIEILSKDGRVSQPKEVESKWLKGGSIA